MASLEAELPRLMEAMGEALNDPVVRKRWQEVKKVLSDVRWDYGPPLEVVRVGLIEP